MAQDVAELVFDIDSSRARTAATDLAKVQGAATSLAAQWAKSDNALRKANGTFRSSISVATQYGSEIRSLAREFNPALNAVYEFQEAETRLNRAVSLGVLTLGQKDAALSALTSQYAAAATGANKAGAATRNMAAGAGQAAANVRNLGYQVNDIAMMTIAGQAPLMLMAQQGFQVIQVMGDMKAAGQSMGTALRTTLTRLASPMNLLTLAAIAGGVALVQWGMGLAKAGDDASTLDKAAESLEKSISAVTNAMQSAALGAYDLAVKYGDGAKEARAWLNVNLQGEIIKQRDALSGMVVELDAASRGYADSVQAGRRFNTVMSRIQSDFGIMGAEAERFSRILAEIGNQKSLEDQTKMANELLSILQRNNVDIEKMPEGFAKALAGMGPIVASALQLLNIVRSISDESSNVTGNAPQTNGGAYLENLERRNKLSSAQIKLEDRTNTILRDAARNNAVITEEKAKQLAQDQLAAEARRAAEDRAAKSSASRGARELAQAQKQFQSLRELLEKESLFEYAEWEKRQAQLDNALNKRLITIQQHHAIESQLQTYFFGTEYARRQLQYDMDLEQLRAALEAQKITREQYAVHESNLSWGRVQDLGAADATLYSQQLSHMAQNFADMNSIAGGGYDGLLKAQRVFGAASALISTYTGAAEALKLPFPYNMMAAGKIMAAGMGFVNAIKSGGNTANTAASSSTASATAATQEPNRYIYVDLQGPDWATDIAESVLAQAYESSRDGQVIFARR